MVTAKILNVEQNEIGNILISVEYTLPDGSKLINPYHSQYLNFIGSTPDEVQDFIRRQIEYQCERYLEAYSKQKINEEVITNTLIDLKDSEFSREKVVWKITDKGEKVTEQLKLDKIVGIVIKKVSIDVNGKSTIEEIT